MKESRATEAAGSDRADVAAPPRRRRGSANAT